MKLAQLNSAVFNPNFGEVDANDPQFKKRTYYLVDDNYDFNANDATEIVGAEYDEWIAVFTSLGRTLNPVVTGSGGEKSIDKSATNGATLSSTTRSFLSSSGREFLAHSGTGSSADTCGFMYLLSDWVSGCKVQVVCTTADDGTKYFVYKAQITIWDGVTKTQEEITLPKILTAGTGSTVYPQLKSTEAEFSSTVLNAMGNGRNISIKITRDAGHADDNYNSSVYTEYCRLIYNY